jgi:hypothetical protein
LFPGVKDKVGFFTRPAQELQGRTGIDDFPAR